MQKIFVGIRLHTPYHQNSLLLPLHRQNFLIIHLSRCSFILRYLPASLSLCAFPGKQFAVLKPRLMHKIHFNIDLSPIKSILSASVMQPPFVPFEWFKTKLPQIPVGFLKSHQGLQCRSPISNCAGNGGAGVSAPGNTPGGAADTTT